MKQTDDVAVQGHFFLFLVKCGGFLKNPWVLLLHLQETADQSTQLMWENGNVTAVSAAKRP